MQQPHGRTDERTCLCVCPKSIEVHIGSNNVKVLLRASNIFHFPFILWIFIRVVSTYEITKPKITITLSRVYQQLRFSYICISMLAKWFILAFLNFSNMVRCLCHRYHCRIIKIPSQINKEQIYSSLQHFNRTSLLFVTY